MTKVIAALLATGICVAGALIPEMVMWFLYGLINPTTELGKILTLAVFWLGGAGLCVFFAILGVVVWINTIDEILRW